jgi:hypothetical protein
VTKSTLNRFELPSTPPCQDSVATSTPPSARFSPALSQGSSCTDLCHAPLRARPSSADCAHAFCALGRSLSSLCPEPLVWSSAIWRPSLRCFLHVLSPCAPCVVSMCSPCVDGHSLLERLCQRPEALVTLCLSLSTLFLHACHSLLVTLHSRKVTWCHVLGGVQEQQIAQVYRL